MKNLTSVCNSFGEKLNVGMRKFRYGRTPFRSRPGCDFNFADASVACGDPDGFALAAMAFICCVCAGVFSPLKDGASRNFKSQAGSTRAPSLVRRGGNRSLPSGV